MYRNPLPGAIDRTGLTPLIALSRFAYKRTGSIESMFTLATNAGLRVNSLGGDTTGKGRMG